MTSATTVSVIEIEPVADNPSNSNVKDKFAQRFKPSSSKPNNQSNNRNQTPSSSSYTEPPLRADDIKDYRIWAIGASIAFFFIIAPFFALYHSRRIREMKNKQELNRAKLLSDRVGTILVISSIIGIVVWVAIIFLIAVLLIMGHFF